MRRPVLNYWLDVAIAVAFAASAVTGLVFLIPVASSGRWFGVSYTVWGDLHTWSSLAVIGGVGLHLALHWKWITVMTSRRLDARSAPVAGALTRRCLLTAGGTLALASGAAMLSLRGLSAASGLFGAGRGTAPSYESGGIGGESWSTLIQTPDALPTSEPLPTAAAARAVAPSGSVADVACRFGLVNDPFPGQCRHYTDVDGDGLCDLSVPG